MICVGVEESRRREKGGEWGAETDEKCGAREVRGGDENRDAREAGADDERSYGRKRAKTFAESPTNSSLQGPTQQLSAASSPTFLIASFKIHFSFLRLFLHCASQITFAG